MTKRMITEKLKDLLTEKDVEDFLKKMLAAAKKEDGSARKKLLDLLIRENALDEIEALDAKQYAEKVAEMRKELRIGLTNDQLDLLITDSKNIALLADRQAGKTSVILVKMLEKALDYPGEIIVYITKTAAQAYRNCWNRIKQLIQVCEIPAKCNKSEGSITFDNGSIIYFRGCDSADAADVLRGLTKVNCVIFDECQLVKNLKTILLEAVEPAQAAAKSKNTILSGTPPSYPGHYFEEVCKSDLWEHIILKGEDNPAIPDYNKYRQDLAAEYGVALDDPRIQRECFHKFVYTAEAIIFRKLNICDFWETELETIKPDVCVIGIDAGFNDLTTIFPLYYNKKSGKALVGPGIANNHMTTEAISRALKSIEEKADEVLKKYQQQPKVRKSQLGHILEQDKGTKIWRYAVCDSAAAQLINDLYVIYKHNIRACSKPMTLEGRLNSYQTMSDLLAKGNILIACECQQLINELTKLSWEINDDESVNYGKIEESVAHPDCSDAVRYAIVEYLKNCGRNLIGKENSKNK